MNTSSRKLRFTKMHGAGNDFIVVNGIDQDLSKITPDQWRSLSNRQFGIGADQILLIEKPTRPDADFRYRIFNSDGGEVEQCGNGSRCFVRYVHEQLPTSCQCLTSGGNNRSCCIQQKQSLRMGRGAQHQLDQ